MRSSLLTFQSCFLSSSCGGKHSCVSTLLRRSNYCSPTNAGFVHRDMGCWSRIHSGSTLSMSSSQTINSSYSLALDATLIANTSSSSVMTTQDILVGIILAFALAFAWITLQNNDGRTSSSTFVDFWSSDKTITDNDESKISESKNDATIKDDTDSFISQQEQLNITKSDGKMNIGNDDKVLNWKEMSRPENYVLYSTRVKQRLDTSSKQQNQRLNNGISFGDNNNDKGVATEKKMVLISLLILFVPIFSIEFFFALSRQFMCGDPMMNGTILTSQKWAQELCAAHF